RFGHKVANGGRVPVIPPRQPGLVVHSLLHDGPIALSRDHERMQIQLEAVGNRVVVDFRGKPAGTYERSGIETGAVTDFQKFRRRAPRLPAATAAEVNAEL